MSIARFWAAPSERTGLPTPAAPPRLHKRKSSTVPYESHRRVIFIYWPTSRSLQVVLVVAVGAVFALLVATVLRNPAHHAQTVVQAQEPSWLRDSLDDLIPCEKTQIPSLGTDTYVFPSPQSTKAHLASKYRFLRSQDPLVLTKRLPQKRTLGLPLSCLDNAIARGLPCPPGSAQPIPSLDVVWTWANGSDPLYVYM